MPTAYASDPSTEFDQPFLGFDRIFRFYDSRHLRILAKILPGEFYLTNSPKEMIVTTLGSCVSACIRDPEAGVGGMNHFMLPGTSHRSNSSFSLNSSANCYGVFAMENLINEILKRGGRRDRLEIKVTGAGRIGWGTGTIGESNAKFIRDYLETEGFHPHAVDLGGSHPRKVQYDPLIGRLRIKKLNCLRATGILEQELDYRKRIEGAASSGAVELFQGAK